MEQIYGEFPDYARDIKVNLQNVLKQAELTEQQTWGTAVASSIASRNASLTEAIFAEARQHLSPQAFSAAEAAAAVMGMNNIYYRFQHLTGNLRYSEIPARFRMQAIRTHGSDPIDFELWCIAVSAINGCGKCVEAHENVLRQKGTTEEIILAAIRIASVVYAAAAVLEAPRFASADAPQRAVLS